MLHCIALRAGRSFEVKITVDDDFDLDAIASSGQCFRWRKYPDGSYCILSQGNCLKIKQTKEPQVFQCSCGEKKFKEFWFDYFDLGTKYRTIRQSVPASDKFLYAATRHETGIRILHQDPWEMLITFIISQRKSIPAIKTAVEALCNKAGHLMKRAGKNIPMYTFPTPKELSRLSMEDLNACGLGYRSRYVYDVARSVAGKHVLQEMDQLSDEDLFQKLMTLTGVGKKVAHCVMLFGYHRLNAFPRDVWINRILEEKYPQGFPYDQYSPYNGIMQQYMFEYYRKK